MIDGSMRVHTGPYGRFHLLPGNEVPKKNTTSIHRQFTEISNILKRHRIISKGTYMNSMFLYVFLFLIRPKLIRTSFYIHPNISIASS